MLCPASLGLTAQDSEPQEVIAFCSPTQILENTPENHPDHSHLKHALEKAEELCSQVNEGVREKENSDRLEWIQAHVQCEGLSEVSGFGGGARARPAWASAASPKEGQPERGVRGRSRTGDGAGDGAGGRLYGELRPGRGRPVCHSEGRGLDPEDSGPDRQERHHSNVPLGKGPSPRVTAADRGARRGLALHLNVLGMKLTLSLAFCGLYTLFEINCFPSLSVDLSTLEFRPSLNIHTSYKGVHDS